MKWKRLNIDIFYELPIESASISVIFWICHDLITPSVPYDKIFLFHPVKAWSIMTIYKML